MRGKRKRHAFAVLGLVFSAFSFAAAAEQTPAEPLPPITANQWHAATREDIEAAFAIFSRRHPGMFDPNNPGFPERLRHARAAALAFANRAVDAEGHMRALAIFSADLADGHARVQATYSGHGALLWPGFTTVWRGEALRILDPAEDGPPRGSVLLDCDGRPARDAIRDAAFSFYGRPDEAGQWWTNAPNFFRPVASPYETPPRSCRFRRPDGHVATCQLNWREVPEAIERAWFAAASHRDPIAFTEPRPDLYRISLPSFSPDEEGLAAYRRLFADLDAGAERLAAARAIVLDLRNNGGGSSAWGQEVAEHLWGKAAVTAAMAAYFRNTRVWWLADPVNVAHLRESAARLRAEGNGEAADAVDAVIHGLDAALRRGDRFYVEEFGAELGARATPALPRRLPPVYVITDGGCASACLDAVDLFTRFPGVKLVGAPTSADSTYLDVMFEPLPSGRGAVALPLKIWVDRPRAAGEIYRPDIPVNDLEWNTDVLLDHIERDLALGHGLTISGREGDPVQ
jgi:hypothetical protein